MERKNVEDLAALGNINNATKNLNANIKISLAESAEALEEINFKLQVLKVKVQKRGKN